MGLAVGAFGGTSDERGRRAGGTAPGAAPTRYMSSLRDGIVAVQPRSSLFRIRPASFKLTQTIAQRSREPVVDRVSAGPVSAGASPA